MNRRNHLFYKTAKKKQEIKMGIAMMHIMRMGLELNFHCKASDLQVIFIII